MPALPSWLIKTVAFLLKRPSDRSIRALRVLFALALAGTLVRAHGSYVLLPATLEAYDAYAQWALLALAAPSLLMGLTGACVAKKGAVRKGQVALAVALFTLGGWLMRVPTAATETVAIPQPAPQAAPAPEKAVTFQEALAGKTAEPSPAPVASAEATFAQAVAATAARPATVAANPGFWIVLLAWLPLAAGFTGKMVTASCQRFGEKVTKIRV